MSDLTVIVPSRGRPHNISRLMQGWADTEATAILAVVCDDDDPELSGYPGDVQVVERKRLGPTLNEVALSVTTPYVGFMGDDHLPRTQRWDEAICAALSELGTGIVYGDDGLQHEALPTAVFMTTNIVQALGYMVPGGLVHLYVDNAWKDWGQRADCLCYLPEVRIEHLHPANGKAPHDAGYAESNSGARDAADKSLYQAYVSSQLENDVAKIRALR